MRLKIILYMPLCAGVSLLLPGKRSPSRDLDAERVHTKTSGRDVIKLMNKSWLWLAAVITVK